MTQPGLGDVEAASVPRPGAAIALEVLSAVLDELDAIPEQRAQAAASAERHLAAAVADGTFDR